MKRGESIKIWAVVFWLLVWQAGSMLLGQEILLVSPLRAASRLAELVGTASFWSSIGFSFRRIAGGFLLALFAGTVLAAFSSRYRRVRELAAPLMFTIKSVPVASFIILALVWLSSKNLSVMIAFLIVLPVIYGNVLAGFEAADRKMLEMADVFRIPPGRRMRYVYLPQIYPYFKSACGIALGLCWKAGVAAEVIGIPVGSIGEKLQQAKVYLDTPDLFAWTFVIVVISVLFEKIFLAVLQAAEKLLRRMDGRPREKMPQGAPAGVRITELRKSFDGEPVIGGLSADIFPGEATALIGPSGSGKTTLLRIVLGLEKADGGSVNIMPQDARFSAVFQEDRLCEDLGPVENVRLVNPSLSVEEVLAAMEEVGLEGSAGRPVRGFSGGMRRRVAILRAVLADWDILALDEPFKGLDEGTKEAVIRFTKDRCRERTVILVTHDPEELELMAEGGELLPQIRL